MSIPEINEEQIELLNSMCGHNDATVQFVPDRHKDPEELYNEGMNKLCDSNQLVILGLLADTTEAHSLKAAEMYAATGRQIRVFEITDVGRSLFKDTTLRSVN